jgi:hypothetical protein
MRRDAVGFFWNDAPVPKPPKLEAPKRTPPERVWERPDYLPGLEMARRFPVDQFTWHDLAAEATGELLFDIECYSNYFQVAFMSKRSWKVIDFELAPDFDLYPDMRQLNWILQNFCIKGFNSWWYDMPMLSFFMAGFPNQELKRMSDAIVVYDENPSDLLKAHKLKRLKIDHVDLKEVSPGFSGLKAYGGRIHVPRMQDLPVNPSVPLSKDQKDIVRWYCVNDLVQTKWLDAALEEQQRLRRVMSAEIGVDLRSKSDAQVAEAVISEELFNLTRTRARRAEVIPGNVHYYKVPSYMQFQTPYMREVLDVVRRCMFVIDGGGDITTPPELKGLKVSIGKATYTMGIGGLHSNEKSVCHRAEGGYKIFDVDVESYYPRIMLNQRLFPQHLGEAFLRVFDRIVQRRLQAKHAGDKTTADSLKITINGTFGKLGNCFSLFYAPDLLMQVTISGQLSLLMLIEMLEMYGFEVISANTDGIAVKVHETKLEAFRAVVKHWEAVTQFKTEETEYALMALKDVNNYIAVKKKDGGVKGKGVYANPWHASAKDPSDRLKKNPAGTICVDAVYELLAAGVPVRTTIYGCRDFTKFVSVRNVSGGAVCGGEYLAKAARWYYSTEKQPEIVSAKTGNKVPKTDGAKPCMELPAEFPADVDYEWYVREAEEILTLVGYS